MPYSSPITSAISSCIDAILKIARQTTQFVEVPNEVRQLQINVRVADGSINTAYRLLSLTEHYLEHDLIDDVQRSIADTELVLKSLRDTVEACRNDLELRQTVGLKNRISWVVFKNQEFLSKLATLTNVLNALNRDITRMEAARVSDLIHIPITYSEDAQSSPGRDEDVIQGFPRAPTVRRRLQAGQIRPPCNDRADSRDHASHHQRPSQTSLSSVSTLSFDSSTTLVDERARRSAEENTTYVTSGPATSFELPATVSLGFDRRGDLHGTRGNTRDTQQSEAAPYHNNPAIKLVPPMPLGMPDPTRGPRRKSNFI